MIKIQAPAPTRYGGGAGTEFGAVQSPEVGTTEYAYTGAEEGSVDPTLGTFTQMDPSGLEDNPYQYATGNPINNIGPTGLASCSATVSLVGILHSAMWGAIIGSAFGLVAGTVAGVVYVVGWWAVATFLCEN